MIYVTFYFLIIGTDIKFNHTNSAMHSLGHSRRLFTSTGDYASAHWRLVLHILQFPGKSLCHRSPFSRWFVTHAIFLTDKVLKKLFVSLSYHTYKHIDMLNFHNKSDRNWCFSFGNFGIIFNSASAQHFLPGRMGNSAGSQVIHRLMPAEINRCRVHILVTCSPHVNKCWVTLPIYGIRCG